MSFSLLEYHGTSTYTCTIVPDRTAQNTGEGGNSEYQDLGLEVDDDDPTDS